MYLHCRAFCFIDSIGSLLPWTILELTLNTRICFFAVPRNQLQSVAAACKVLIEFSLLRLENPDEACAVSQVSTGLDLLGQPQCENGLWALILKYLL